MSTIITTSTTSTTGYKLVINDNGLVTEIDVNEFDKNNAKSIKLPENPSNRKYFSIEKIEKNGGEIELTYKESIKMGERAPRMDVTDFLTEDERKELDEAKAKVEDLMNLAKTRREEAKKKPMTEKEKAQKKLDKAIEGLKSLGVTEEEIQAILARN